MATAIHDLLPQPSPIYLNHLNPLFLGKNPVFKIVKSFERVQTFLSWYQDYFFFFFFCILSVTVVEVYFYNNLYFSFSFRFCSVWFGVSNAWQKEEGPICTFTNESRY